MTDPQPPAPTGQQRQTSTGCLWMLLLAPVVIVAGLVLGAIAGRDRGADFPEEVSSTLAEGDADGTPWRVDAKRDVEGDTCAFIFVDGEQLTGACGTVPQDATLTDTLTVVFGKAPGEAERVRVGLTDGRDLDLDTVAGGDVQGRFYVVEVDGDADLDVTGDLEVLAP